MPPPSREETAILRSPAARSILLLAALAAAALVPGPARACSCLSPTAAVVERGAQAEERRPWKKAPPDLMRQMRRLFKPSSS